MPAATLAAADNADLNELDRLCNLGRDAGYVGT